MHAGTGRRGRGAVLALVFALAALVWGLAPRAQEGFDSDGAIFALASTQAWTPFFWGQDRLGMLLPLVAMPVEDPVANYLTQVCLAAVALLVALVLVSREAAPVGTHAEAGLLGAVVLAAALPPYAHHTLLGRAPVYALGLALGLGGHVLLRRGGAGRGFAGAALLLLAVWVNQAMAPVLVLMVLLEGGLRVHRGLPWRRAAWPTALASVAAYGLVDQLGRVQGLKGSTPLALAPPVIWSDLWRELAVTWWAQHGRPGLPVWVVLTVLALAALLHPRSARVARARLRAAAPLLVAASLFTGVLAITEHVMQNEFQARYAMLLVLALVGVLAAVLVGAFRVAAPDAWRRAGPRGRPILLGLVLVAVLAARMGLPSPAAAEAQLASRYGAAAADVVRHGCTHVMGDYWTTWSVVMLAEAALHRSGEKRRVFGVSRRMRPTLGFWQRMPEEELVVASVPPGYLEHEAPRDYDFLVYPLGHEPAITTDSLAVYRHDPLYSRLRDRVRVLRGHPGAGSEAPWFTVRSGEHEPGVLLEGPEWPLRRGDYELEVRIRFEGVEDPAVPAAALWVPAGEGEPTLLLRAVEPGDSRLQFTVPFGTPGVLQGAPLFSFRLVWGGRVGLVVDRVRLRRRPGVSPGAARRP